MPALNARSTSSGVATPSSTRRTASFMRSACIRGPMKPGESAQRTGTLPSSSSTSMVRSTAAAAVAWPGTTSTSGMMWAGLSQCATRKRSGRWTASARCAGEIVELVEAMIASEPTRAESRRRTSRLRSSSSGSASWTKPHVSRPSRPTRSSTRSSAGATSPSSITPSSAMSLRSRAISRRASVKTTRRASGARSLTSTRRTRRPPRAKASAIWRPILPGPTTTTAVSSTPAAIAVTPVRARRS